MLRGEPDLRGNWTHAGRVLSGEARWRGVDGPYAWPYTPYTRGGAWLLASPAGVIACRPGHDRAASGGGSWVRVRPAGGDPTLVGRALAGRDELALVVLDSPADPVDGIVLVYAGEDAPRGLAQALADALQLPVRLAAEPIDAPVEVRVGR